MAVLGVGFTAPFERVFAGRGAGFAAQGPVQINTEPTPTAAMPDDFVAEGLTVEGRGIGCRSDLDPNLQRATAGATQLAAGQDVVIHQLVRRGLGAQVNRFEQAIGLINLPGVDPNLGHPANHDITHFGWHLRCMLALTGCQQDKQQHTHYPHDLGLRTCHKVLPQSGCA